MKTKIKLLFWSFLTIFSIFSTTSAVEFYWDIRTEEVVGEYNWYNMDYQANSYNYLWCIVKRYASQASLKTTKFCEDWMYVMHSTSAYISVLMGSSYWFRSEGNFFAWKKDDSNNIFSFKVLNEEGKKRFYRFWIKNVWGKSVKLNSKRGSAVYNSAFMDGIWFVLTKRDWDQVKVSHVVDNVFALDGFLVVARDWDSYLIDTYTNKMYKYNNGLFPMNRYAKGEVESIFPKIWDNVPSEVSDIQRGPLGDYKMYYNQNEFKSFDLKNTREATESDLNEIRDNIKKSIVVFNQEFLHLYWDVEWLDLSVWQSSDLPSNPNFNNKEQSYEDNLKEYNSCTSYWNNIKTYTTYDKECYRSLLDSAPLTWAVNHKKLLAPRNAVVNWNGEWELDIDTEDRICLQFKDRKAVYKQKRSKQWEEFQAISKENWLSPSWINVAEKCGQRPERSLWGKITHPSESFQNWRDSFNWFWWSAIVVSGDQKLYNYDYRADTEELKRLRELCFEKDFMERNFLKEEEVDQQKKHYCERYYKKKAEILKKYQNWDNFFNWKTLTWYINEIWSWDHQYVDLKRLKSFLDRISKPYESWFNSIDFVKPMCWSYKTDFFNIFIYVFFFGWVLYFIKILK